MSRDQKSEPNPEKDVSSETPPVSGRKRTGGRASMRAEFMALFRDTRLTPPPAEGLSGREPPPAEGTAAEDAAPGQAPLGRPAPEPSRFLRRYLQQAAPSPELAPSGLTTLDARLGGGFSYGLHLVLGPPGSGKTSLLESLAWEAVAERRPVLYYAFKTGSLRAWERLIATLGTILDGPAVTSAALRGHDLAPQDIENLSRLDAVLQALVLPYLSLIDGSPAIGSLSAFIEDLRSRAQEAAEQHGRLPLVLVDDLERLVVITRSRSPLHLLSRLDDALVADSVPGLTVGAPDGVLPAELEHLPVRTVLSLTPILPSSVTAAPERVDLEVRKNATTGWTGSLSLLLDARSGLFAESRAGG